MAVLESALRKLGDILGTFAALLRIAQVERGARRGAFAPLAAGIVPGVHVGPVIDVADDGPGVPEAERGKVPGRFYCLDRSRTTAGTGLGLAVVAAVARLHGGEVRLDDAHPGNAPPGLRAQVALPRFSVSA